jgi:bifunctional non-homologous end joining protein LigD
MGKEQPLQENRCGLETPDFVIFDLDPYIYSGKERRGQEPEYNVKGFKAAVEVAHELKDLLGSLKIKSYVKTSGKTGLHVFVPVAPLYTYDQTRSFAEIVGKILSRKTRNKITMEWTVSKRKGKVFFDHNQNAKGKTVASVFSARPTRSATVSMPVYWKSLDKVLPTDFTMLNVPDILKKTGEPWQDILEKGQDLSSILENVP